MCIILYLNIGSRRQCLFLHVNLVGGLNFPFLKYSNERVQAAGACWYLLGIQRAAKCLKEQCIETPGCGLGLLSCKEPIYYGTTRKVMEKARWAWADNKLARSMCLDSPDKYDYGAYKWTVQLVTNDSRLEKILFPIFWGLMTLR